MLRGPKMNLLAVAVFFWGWRATATEEGDDRVSGTDADGHDHISRDGSSEFGRNADSAVSLTRAPLIC